MTVTAQQLLRMYSVERQVSWKRDDTMPAAMYTIGIATASIYINS